jgi:hypothetical protein
VHFGSPQWIEIQARHLREHVRVPHRTWASMQEIDPSYAAHFDFVIEQQGSHAGKLNHLASEIVCVADADDVLMFLDGDAFPIADPVPLIERSLQEAPLVAVRRRENAGDPQPHPCFCATTAGTWRRLAGDWSAGYSWVNDAGERVSDVGGNLLRKLELTRTPWVQVLRSNRTDLDPVFFAIYGDVIYHHGAGFRGARGLHRLHVSRAPNGHASATDDARNSIARVRRQLHQRRTRRRLSLLSDRVMTEIQRGDSAWLAELR